jgi:hypothetical protein
MRKAGGTAGVLSALALAMAFSGSVGAQEELDRNQVTGPMNQAWHDRFRCMPVDVCNSYFDSFGVALVFADGSTHPLEHLRRGDTSGHDCLKRAKDYLARGDRIRAVEWAIASQTSAKVRDWMLDHPDEVLELLHDCCK